MAGYVPGGTSGVKWAQDGWRQPLVITAVEGYRPEFAAYADPLIEEVWNIPTTVSVREADGRYVEYDLLPSGALAHPTATVLGAVASRTIVGEKTRIQEGARVGYGPEDEIPRVTTIGSCAIIGASAEIADGCIVGNDTKVNGVLGYMCTVGENAVVEKGADLGSGVVLGEDTNVGMRARLGRDVRTEQGVTVLSNVKIAGGALVTKFCRVTKDVTKSHAVVVAKGVPVLRTKDRIR